MGNEEEDLSHSATSVTSLKKRKLTLEAILEEKNKELKKLCIAEAELTGVLPVETPFEPSGSPPKFRRRVGTMFQFTEEMLKNVNPVHLQISSKGRVCGSPKRGRPLCQWLKYETLPNKGSQSANLPPSHATWSHSPTKPSTSRIHPYILNLRSNPPKKL